MAYNERRNWARHTKIIHQSLRGYQNIFNYFISNAKSCKKRVLMTKIGVKKAKIYGIIKQELLSELLAKLHDGLDIELKTVEEILMVWK